MGQTLTSRADEFFTEESPNQGITKSPSLNKLNEQLSVDETFVDDVPSPTTPRHNQPYKVVIYGDVGVGKTSLNRRLVGKPYQKLEKKTIGKNTFCCDSEFFQRIFKFQITDFSGQRHFINISTMNAKDADVVIFVYDVTRKSTFLNISQWYQTVMESCRREKRSEDDKIVFLIVGNMTDQPSGRAVSTKEGEDFANENNFMFVECSAKTDDELDKKILLMLAKKLSDHSLKKKTSTQVTNRYLSDDEWTFNALLRNDIGQTVPVLVVYSRKQSNLIIRKVDIKNTKTSKDKKEVYMGIELSTTKQLHYCMQSRTILILDSDDTEQRIIWTCNIVSSPIPFKDLIISLVFEAKVPMIEIAEYGSVSDILNTYTKQCVLMKDIPSSIIVNQFQMMNYNTNLTLNLSNFSFFQTNSKQKPRAAQISSLFEPIKWTYGMLSVLNLANACLGDTGIEILCDCLKLQCVYQLKSLILSNNEISDTGCSHLKKLFQITSDVALQQLDMSMNVAMKDVGCKKIVEISRNLRRLRALKLAGCGAGNESASTLIEVLNYNRKLKVDLSNNNITMAISDMLLALPEDCLKSITFLQNPIMSDTRISVACEQKSNNTANPPTKQPTNKLIFDQGKLQIHGRVMNSVSTYTSPTFHGVIKEQKKAVEIRVFEWSIDYEQRQDAMKAVLQDLTLLSKIEHANCATYYGILSQDSLIPPSSLNILIENFGSSLSNWLYLTNYEFSDRDKIVIALEAAQGIQHLHSQNSIHLNISSDTVMVQKKENSLQVKINYFGLNRWLQRGYIPDFRNAVYQSPELLKSKGKTGGTMKSDVYAFSLLLWELWYGKKPYSLDMLYYNNRKELLRQISDTGKRPSLPAIPVDSNLPKYKCERRVQALIHSCWQHDPTLRPDFKYINIALKDTLDSLGT